MEEILVHLLVGHCQLFNLLDNQGPSFRSNESANYSLHPARIIFAGDHFVRRNMQMIKEATKSMNSASGSIQRGGRSQTTMTNERRKIVL